MFTAFILKKKNMIFNLPNALLLSPVLRFRTDCWSLWPNSKNMKIL